MRLLAAGLVLLLATAARGAQMSVRAGSGARAVGPSLPAGLGAPGADAPALLPVPGLDAGAPELPAAPAGLEPEAAAAALLEALPAPAELARAQAESPAAAALARGVSALEQPLARAGLSDARRAALDAYSERYRAALSRENHVRWAARLDRAAAALGRPADPGEVPEGAAVAARAGLSGPSLLAASDGPAAGAEPGAPPAPQPPSRKLGLVTMLAHGINSIVGAGIFLFPAQLAGIAGGASVLAFAVTGLVLMTVGLCFAEAATYARNEPGAAYVYARDAFGPRTAFAVGWMSWVAQMVAWAAVASAISMYAGFFWAPLAGALGTKLIAGAVIAAMGLAAYAGAGTAGRVIGFFTAAKLLPLLVFVGAGLIFFVPPSFVLSTLDPRAVAPAALAQAALLTFFPYKGFQAIGAAAGDVDRPTRTIPLTVIGSLAGATVLYALIQAVALGVHPGLAGSKAPLAEAAQIMLGPVGATLMAAGAVISAVGTTSSQALVTPSYLEALARDGHLPRRLAERDARRGTATRAILLSTAITLALAVFVPLSSLAHLTTVAVSVQFLSTTAAIHFLRKRGGAAEGGFRVPGGLLIPVLGFLATLAIVVSSAGSYLYLAAAVLAGGYVLSWALARR